MRQRNGCSLHLPPSYSHRDERRSCWYWDKAVTCASVRASLVIALLGPQSGEERAMGDFYEQVSEVKETLPRDSRDLRYRSLDT
jgi:hypothetical protein